MEARCTLPDFKSRGNQTLATKEFPICIKPDGEDFPENGGVWEPKEHDLHSRTFISIPTEPQGRIRKSVLRRGEGNNERPGYGDTIKLYARVFRGMICLAKHLVTYRCGEGTPLKIWDLAVPTMKVNEWSLFLIRPPYTQGVDVIYPGIPADCPLLFEIKLISWNREDLSTKKDKGILRRIIEPPFGISPPNFGAYVKAHIAGFHGGAKFDDRMVEFHIGEGCLQGIPAGVEMALTKFCLGERSRLYLAPAYAFGNEGKPRRNIPPNATVEYDVVLFEFQKAKEVWDMNSDDKWNYSVLSNEKGTVMYRIGQFKPALKQFKKVIRYLENEPGVTPEEFPHRQRVLLTGFLNAAACHLKLRKPMKAIRICDKALQIDPTSEKGLYRRGQGRLEVHDYDEALQDFKTLYACYPENRSAKSKIIECQSCISEHKRKEHSLYGNMFKKFAEEDEEKRKQQQNQTETGIWIDQDQTSSPSADSQKEEEDAVVQMLNK